MEEKKVNFPVGLTTSYQDQKFVDLSRKMGRSPKLSKASALTDVSWKMK